MTPLSTGEAVRLTYRGRTVPAVVELVSGNGRSLVLTFDAKLGGFAGRMAVLAEGDGTLSEMFLGEPVTIRRINHAHQ